MVLANLMISGTLLCLASLIQSCMPISKLRLSDCTNANLSCSNRMYATAKSAFWASRSSSRFSFPTRMRRLPGGNESPFLRNSSCSSQLFSRACASCCWSVERLAVNTNRMFLNSWYSVSRSCSFNSFCLRRLIRVITESL